MHAYVWQDDPALRRFIDEAAADAATVGLLLSGSRGAGVASDNSDYDLYWVLDDAAYARRQADGEPMKRSLPADVGRSDVEIMDTSPARLAELATRPGWWTPGYADTAVLLDKRGDLASLVAALGRVPDEKARADAAGWFDSYLNAFYRSMKAWRRGDELGGRLHAAESAMTLVRTLFSLERRPAPYHDRLNGRLDLLVGQGWPPGYLDDRLLRLVRDGDPVTQAEVEGRVEALLRARGYGHVIDGWDGKIERTRALAVAAREEGRAG